LANENNKNKWWLRKAVIVATHKKPDEDAILAVALMKMFGAKIEGYWFFGEGDEALPNQIKVKNLLFIDRGRRDFDHHGIKGKTTAQIVAEELEIANEKWLRPILAHVKRVDLEGRSEPLDLNDMIKAISRELDDDQKIMELGIEIATSIILFHKEGKKRENVKAAIIIKEFFGDETKMPKRVQHYFKLLQNPNFVRPLDFVELATVDEGLAREVLKFILSDIGKYIEAEKEIEKAQKIEVLGRFIVVGKSDNPKFNVKGREAGAAIVIQKNSNGHVQIYFNNKILSPGAIEKISEDLIEILRMREISLDPTKKMPFKNNLRKPEKIEEVPEWYLFIGEKGGRLILNGSLTAPDVPPTKIELSEIIEFAVDVLRNYLENELKKPKTKPPLK
jgi:hypothetical protein